MSRFSEAYRQLNSAQKQAVDLIDGPVMVVAGPGTGKTQLLAVRVANILAKTDASPSNILCLTFTNKAATNMRQRLDGLIGQGSTSVAVQTFHSLAAEIMNRNAEFFWEGASLHNVPDSVQLAIIEELLNDLPADHQFSRRFDGNFTQLRNIKDGLKLAKEAGLTPEKLQSLTAANLAYIDLIEPELVAVLLPKMSLKRLPEIGQTLASLTPEAINIPPLLALDEVLRGDFEFAAAQDASTNKTTNLSAWKRKIIQQLDKQPGMHKERKRNQWWLDLAELYALYRQRLHANLYYDYADMIVEVVNQLENQPELHSSLQEQYLYVLIDEFQDTNPAQLRLAHLVANHPETNGQPNLMVVGDDDQAIYRFNGAELNNLINFRKYYAVKQPIVLTENYRNSQAILDQAAIIADEASDRLTRREPDIKKQLVARRGTVNKSFARHLSFPDQPAEISAMADLIDSQFSASAKESIAVMAYKHRSLKVLAAELKRRDIPIIYERSQNALNQPAVVSLLNLARTVLAISEGDLSSSNYYLSQLLREPVWHIEPARLWEMAAKNASQPNWLDSLLRSKQANLQTLGKFLITLAQDLANAPLAYALETLLGLRQLPDLMASPIRDYWLTVNQGQSYVDLLAAIRALRNLSEEFAYMSKGQTTLKNFLALVDRIQSDESILGFTSKLAIESDKTPPVELLTIHKAKGLEFDHVYVLDAIDSEWSPKANRFHSPINLPLQPYGDDPDDFVRLMYVAITRARQTFTVASYRFNQRLEPILAAPSIRIALPAKELAAKNIDQQIASYEMDLKWPDLDQPDLLTAIKPLLLDYQLNVTGLINFLDVTRGGPRNFRQRNILRLPDVKSESQLVGSAIHKALEVGQIDQNKQAFSLIKVLKAFSRELGRYSQPEAVYKTLDKRGQQIIKRLFDKLGYKLPDEARGEQSLSQISLGEATANGQFDRVEVINDTSLLISDYKTGRPVTSLDSGNQSLQLKIWKHRLQLNYYQLLAAKSPIYAKFQDISSQMIYVETDKIDSLILKHSPTAEELATIQKLINKVWRLIQSGNFPDTSTYPANHLGVQQFIGDILADKV